MSVIDKAVEWAEGVANDNMHGYSQQTRWGPSYDCSSFVIAAWKQAGVPLTCTYTGNMFNDLLAHGFVEVTDGTHVRGDVLLNEANHVAMMVSGSQLVHARSAEGTSNTFDDSGNEIRVQGYYDYPWDYILRYAKKDSTNTTNGVYTVGPGDSLWSIARDLLGNGSQYTEIIKANGLSSNTIKVGQTLVVPGYTKEQPVVVETTTATRTKQDVINDIKKLLEEIERM